MVGPLEESRNRSFNAGGRFDILGVSLPTACSGQKGGAEAAVSCMQGHTYRLMQLLVLM